MQPIPRRTLTAILPLILLAAAFAPPPAALAAQEAAVPADTLHKDRQRRATAYIAAGRQRLDVGDAQGAIQALQQALRADPNNAAAYFQLGLALRDYGAVPMATRVLRSFIRLGSDAHQVEQAQQIIRRFGFTPPPSPAEALAASGFIGAQACGGCHTEKFAGFSRTAHHLTSGPANATTILGSFAAERATLSTRDPNLWFEMSQRPDGFYQTANTWANNRLQERSERFDMVIGSGKIGQSYLYWQGDRLFQLPISYSADSDAWINSPGFRDGEAFFDRQIIPRCLECHSTYFNSVQRDKNIHGQSAFILGISCERCHGPGSQHARYYRQTPTPQANAATDTARYITHPGLLEPHQLIELCAQCHSNTGKPQRAPFTFRPGDAIADHFAPPQEAETGVHAANQVGRLAASKCFQQSDAMTCITCHNPHALERGDTALFSSRCQQCHTPEICSMGPEVGMAIRHDCISCHMPLRRDTHTQIQSANDLASPLMPDHRIAIYPDATQQFLEQQAAQD